MFKLLKYIKVKHSFYDFGFYILLFNYFTLLPTLVWYFNPDDLILFPIELGIIGVAITLLLGLSYFLINLVLKIPILIKILFSSLALLLFVIMLFFPTQTGVIDGFKKETTPNIDVFLDLGKYLLAFAIILITIFSKKTASFARVILICTSLFGIFFVIYACVIGFSYGLDSKKQLWETFKNDQQDIFAFEELGIDKNVIILLWDGLQGKIAEEIFKENPNANRIYEGFEFYPNAIGAAPNTLHSVPVIFSGKFQKIFPIKLEFIQKIIYRDSIFLDAKLSGYKVACWSVLPTLNIGGFTNFKDFKNINYLKKRSNLIYYLFLLRACQKRVTPLIVQRLFIQTTNKVREKFKRKINYIDINKTYFERLKPHIQMSNLRKGNYNKKLIFIHFNLTHEPYLSEKDFGYLRSHAKAVFKYALIDFMNGYLSRLKELGVYDNSMIFVIADHGARTSETSEGIVIGNSPFDLSYTNISIYPGGAYNPLFMVKNQNANGEMKIFDYPALLSDIRNAVKSYIKNMNIKKEGLFNLSDKYKRKIELLLLKKSKESKQHGAYSFVDFFGNLEDISGYL